jgi:hypothetical protein
MYRMLVLTGVVATGLVACVAAQVDKPVGKATRLRLLPGGKLSSYSVVRLLDSAGVLDELKMTEKQRAEMKKADDELVRQHEAVLQRIQRDTPKGEVGPD